MTQDQEEQNVSGVSSNLADAVDQSLEHEAIQEISPLEGLRVGISISESEELHSLGFSLIHQRDAMVEFARYLLILGCNLIYGGDLRNGGFTFLFSELAFQYRRRSDQEKIHFVNFFSFPIYLKLTQIQQLEFKKNRVETKFISPPNELAIDNTQYIVPDNIENKIIWAKSLTKMRQEMTADTDARIFIGGKLSGFLGKYPGIVEEASLSLENNKPCYLIGAYGGATGAMINLLNGTAETRLEADFQFGNTSFKEFMEVYNQENTNSQIDFYKLNQLFRNYTIERLSKNNGLTLNENRRLFETKHIPEMIYLVTKGLNNLKNNPR